MDGVQNPAGLGEESLLVFGRRGDPVAGAQHHGGSIQIVEGQLVDMGGHVVDDAAADAGVGGQDDPAGLFHGGQDLLIVEGHHAAGVDDLSLQAELLLQNVGSLQGLVQGGADGQDGDILALALDVGLAEGDLIGLGGHALQVELLAMKITGSVPFRAVVIMPLAS